MKDKIKLIFNEATGGKVELQDSFFESMTTLVESQAAVIADNKAQQLNESHQKKVRMLKESTNTRINDVADDYAILLNENHSKLSSNLNQFMKHALNEWAVANAPVLDSNIKVRMAEGLFSDMKNLMENHNINIDARTEKLMESKTGVITELEKQLNESERKIVKTQTLVESMKREKIIDSIAVKRNLTESQKERFTRLSEDVDFKSEGMFTNKINTLVESMLTDGKSTNGRTRLNEEVVIKPAIGGRATLNKGDQSSDPYARIFLK